MSQKTHPSTPLSTEGAIRMDLPSGDKKPSGAAPSRALPDDAMILLPVRNVVLHLLAAGSSRGTAFPSSHIAASVVASLCALQSGRRTGIAVSVLTAGLTAATVYGGFHYAVDAGAGLVVGVATWLLSRRVWAALERSSAYEAPGEHRTSAPA